MNSQNQVQLPIIDPNSGSAKVGELIMIVTVIIALVLVIYGFVEVLRKKRSGVSEIGQISVQLRGFGHIAVAPMVMVAGSMIGALLIRRAIVRQ